MLEPISSEEVSTPGLDRMKLLIVTSSALESGNNGPEFALRYCAEHIQYAFSHREKPVATTLDSILPYQIEESPGVWTFPTGLPELFPIIQLPGQLLNLLRVDVLGQRFAPVRCRWRSSSSPATAGTHL